MAASQNVVIRNTACGSVTNYVVIGDENMVGTIQFSPIGAGAWDNFEYMAGP